MTLDDIESKIERITETGCWIWMGTTKKPAPRQLTYGIVNYKGKGLNAHRAVYQMVHGDLRRDQLVCHRCDVPECVNPAHMFIGSHSENLIDAVRKGRRPKEYVMVKERINARPKVTKEPSNFSRKMTNATVLWVRDMAKLQLMTYKEMAVAIGCHVNTIKKLMGGRSYRHIEKH